MISFDLRTSSSIDLRLVLGVGQSLASKRLAEVGVVQTVSDGSSAALPVSAVTLSTLRSSALQITEPPRFSLRTSSALTSASVMSTSQQIESVADKMFNLRTSSAITQQAVAFLNTSQAFTIQSSATSSLRTGAIQLIIPEEGLSALTCEEKNVAVVLIDFNNSNDFVAIDYTGVEISAESGEPLISASVFLSDQVDFVKIIPDTSRVRIHLGGEILQLVVISSSLGIDEVSSRSFKIGCQSEGFFLSASYAKNVGEVIDYDTSNKELITSLADGFAIDVSAIPESLISKNTADFSDSSPLAAIVEVAEASGSFVQTLPSSGLTVSQYYKKNLHELDASDATISLDQYGIRGIVSSFERHENFNEVLITNNETDSETESSMEEVTDSELAKEYSTNARELRCYEVPFSGDIQLVSASRNITTTYLSTIRTESTTETIQIIEGVGSVSKPVYGVSSCDYQRTELGEISFEEDGSISTEIAGNSLAKITYTTKFYQFIVDSSELEQVLFVAIGEDNV